MNETPLLNPILQSLLQAQSRAASEFGTISMVDIDPPVANTPTLTGGGSLVSGTPHFWVVSAVDGVGETLQSNEVTITPSGANLTAVVTWSAVPGAVSYKLFRSTTTGVYGATSLVASGIETASYNDTGAALSAGQPLAQETSGFLILAKDPVGALHPVTLQYFAAHALTNPMTTAGDLILGITAGAPARLEVGTNGQVLTVVAGVPAWANSASGFTNPMTAVGDLIVGGSLGAGARLPAGADGTILTVVSSTPAWGTVGNGLVMNAGSLHFAQSAAYTIGRVAYASSTSAMTMTDQLTYVATTKTLSVGDVADTVAPVLQTQVGEISVSAVCGTWNMRAKTGPTTTKTLCQIQGTYTLGSSFTSSKLDFNIQNGGTFRTALTLLGTLTLAVAIPNGSCLEAYNTTDQTTNYERVRMIWSSNVFGLISQAGGSGISRTISVEASSAASSGVATAVRVLQTLTQSATAGYTALLVNAVETSTGSGAKLLQDWQVGGTSKAAMDDTGQLKAVGFQLASFSTGDVLYLNSSGVFTRLAIGSTGDVLTVAAGLPSWAAPGGGSGTVTSVALTVPSFLSVSGSPVTTSGTLAVTLANQNANLVFAGPSTGAAAAPTFRALVDDDIPAVLTLTQVIFTLQTLSFSATTDLDFDAGINQTVSLTGDVTFTTSNRAAGKTITLRIVCDGTGRTFTFPSWKFIGGAAPASIAASKTAELQITAYGTADTDIVAAYAVEP
jgi:hypothetical protein